MQHRTASQEDLLLTANVRFLNRVAENYGPKGVAEILHSEAQNALLSGQKPPFWYRSSAPAANPPSPGLMANIGNRLGGRPSTVPDPLWARQATAYDRNERYLAGQSIDAGQAFDIDQHAHDSAVSVMGAFEKKLPGGVKIGVLNRIEPTGDPNVVKGLFSDAPDFANYVRRDLVSDAAAVWDPATRRIMIARYGTGGFRSFGGFAEGVEGEIHHELAHAMSALQFTTAQRDALLKDANALGVLDVPFRLYSALKRGSSPSEGESPASLRDTYAELYKIRDPSMKQFLLEEEAIAVMAEYYHFGVIEPNDLFKTSRSLLDKILSMKGTKGDYEIKTSNAAAGQLPAISSENARLLTSYLRSKGGIQPSPEVYEANAHTIPELVSDKGMAHHEALSAVANARHFDHFGELPDVQGAPGLPEFYRLLNGAVAAEHNRVRNEALASHRFSRAIWQISFPLIRHDVEMGRPWEAHRFMAGLGIPEHLRTPYISALQNHMASWPQQQQQQSSAS
ncbi:MAG: hypothetical protein WBX25_31565 [Rhodomicrobium sp.]